MNDELKAQAQTIQGLAKSLERAYEENARLRDALEAYRSMPDPTGYIMNQLGSALNGAGFQSDYDSWQGMVDAAAEAIRSEAHEWPKFYVPTSRFSEIQYMVHYGNGTCLRVWRNRKEQHSTWSTLASLSVERGYLREVEPDETTPRELPEEGTGEWAVWRMRTGRPVKATRQVGIPGNGNIADSPYRIHDGALEFWSYGRWKESRHNLKTLAKYDIWQVAPDPEAENAN